MIERKKYGDPITSAGTREKYIANGTIVPRTTEPGTFRNIANVPVLKLDRAGELAAREHQKARPFQSRDFNNR